MLAVLASIPLTAVLTRALTVKIHHDRFFPIFPLNRLKNIDNFFDFFVFDPFGTVFSRSSGRTGSASGSFLPGSIRGWENSCRSRKSLCSQ